MKKCITLVSIWILGASSSIAAGPYLNLLGSLSVPNVFRMAIDESYVYLLVLNSYELIVVDISDPSRLVEIGRTVARADAKVKTERLNTSSPQYRRSLAIPNYAYEWPYFYFGDGAGLNVIDVGDPQRPQELVYDWMKDGSLGDVVWGARNHRLLLTKDVSEGVRIDYVDVADIARPRLLGSLEVGERNQSLSVVWESDSLVCAMPYNNRYQTKVGNDLLLIDLRENVPRLIASHPLPGMKLFSHIDDFLYVVFYGETARSFNLLQKIDLRDPQNPIFRETVQLDYYLHEIFAFRDSLLSYVYDKRPFLSFFQPDDDFMMRESDIPAPEDLILYQVTENYLIGVVMTMDGRQLNTYEIEFPAVASSFESYD